MIREYKTEEKDRFEVSSGRRMSAKTLAGDGRILNQYVRLKLHLLSTYEHFNKLFCSRKVIDKSILITDIKIIRVH